MRQVGTLLIVMKCRITDDNQRSQARLNKKRTMNKAAAIFSVLVLSASVAFAQDKARAIVEKAIQAKGGEAKVARLRMMSISAEGTADVVPGQTNVPFTIENTWQMPDRYKTSSAFQVSGKKLVQTQVIDGDKGWIQMNGKTQDLPEEAVTEMREQKYAEDLDRLSFLNETGFELAALEPITVAGKLALGVLVKSKGHRDVKLYFDATSGLLVKREHRLLDSLSGKRGFAGNLFQRL